MNERTTPQTKAKLPYEDLSEDAKETLEGMVHLCLNRGYAMGMDEGFDENDNKREFRKELEAFCGIT